MKDCRKKWIVVLILLLTNFSKAGRILFDFTKSETAGNADWVVDHDYPYPLPAQPSSPTSWDGAISSWGYRLYSYGHEVATLIPSYGITYANSSNPFDLSNFDVFIMVEPQNPLSIGEREAILNYISNGGGFLMIADHNSSDRDGDGWDSPRVLNNAFEFTLGVHFNITGERPNSYSGVSTNILRDQENLIYNGPFGCVQSLGFWSGTCAVLNPGVNPSVFGLVWVPGAMQDHDSVMFFFGYFGNGRFAGMGDSSPCDDGTGNPSDNLYDNWSMYSDSVLILNATLWLMEGSSKVEEKAHKSSFSTILKVSEASQKSNEGIIFYDILGREVLPLKEGLYFINRSKGVIERVIVR